MASRAITHQAKAPQDTGKFKLKSRGCCWPQFVHDQRQLGHHRNAVGYNSLMCCFATQLSITVPSQVQYHPCRTTLCVQIQKMTTNFYPNQDIKFLFGHSGQKTTKKKNTSEKLTSVRMHQQIPPASQDDICARAGRFHSSAVVQNSTLNRGSMSVWLPQITLYLGRALPCKRNIGMLLFPRWRQMSGTAG